MCEPTELQDAPDEALAAIMDAAEGLLVPSDGDYPFEPFRWPGPGPLTPEALRTHLGLSPDAPVEARDGSALLDRLAAVRDWHGEAERAVAARFAELRDVIGARLSDVVEYRVGSLRVTVIITGYDASGEAVGLRTTLIAT